MVAFCHSLTLFSDFTQRVIPGPDMYGTFAILGDLNNDYRRFTCSRDGGFNIDAKINAAYIAMGLLYGSGDIEDTCIISMRCGQDSDCNPSNALGILSLHENSEEITVGIPQTNRLIGSGRQDAIFTMREYVRGRIDAGPVHRARDEVQGAFWRLGQHTIRDDRARSRSHSAAMTVQGNDYPVRK